MTAAATLHRVRAALPRGGALPDEIWERRHRGIFVFAALHVPVLVLISVLKNHLHPASIAAIFLVAVLASVGGAQGSRRLRSSAVTASLCVSTALLIHLFDGLIEIHFHFFVVIAVVAMYQSWTPYFVALGFVLFHHGVVGTVEPTAVYNHPAAIDHPWLFALIHAAFVLAESAACLTYWRLNEQALDSERDARRQAEEVGAKLSRANDQIADLLAMMSHDLRAPVSVVTGYAALSLDAWDELDDDTHRAFVTKMGAAGRTLEQMLSETLTMAAMDSDGLQANPCAVPVDEVAREVLASLSDPMSDATTDDLRPVVAWVDESHLSHILTNLLTNAAKYGAPPLEVSCAATEAGVEIRVRDQGPGVPADFVPQLFDRYARSDDAVRGNQKGTGLGLYITQQLAEANGGGVRHEHPAGGGACFVVTLPACENRTRAAAATADQGADLEGAAAPTTGRASSY